MLEVVVFLYHGTVFAWTRAFLSRLEEPVALDVSLSHYMKGEDSRSHLQLTHASTTSSTKSPSRILACKRLLNTLFRCSDSLCFFIRCFAQLRKPRSEDGVVEYICVQTPAKASVFHLGILDLMTFWNFSFCESLEERYIVLVGNGVNQDIDDCVTGIVAGVGIVACVEVAKHLAHDNGVILLQLDNSGYSFLRSCKHGDWIDAIDMYDTLKLCLQHDSKYRDRVHRMTR